MVILDVKGVGYSAGIPLSTFLDLGEIGAAAELYIYTHVTDSSLSLYGFTQPEEKDIFMKLISISGIGPKIALSILSGIGVSDLEDAIRTADIARLSLIPGIGKKTAQRIALELQEKLGHKASELELESYREKEDLVSALVNMGFRHKEVEKIVAETIKEFTAQAGFETLLREGLKRLAKI